MKAVRIISIFLGFSMFMFGILKLVNPFRGWYSVQIRNSGLSENLYWPGIIGEITTGLLFLGIGLFRNAWSEKAFRRTSILASTMVVVIMATAIYTHLCSDVPADVLPLKIKPPFIPGLFLVLAIADIVIVRRMFAKTP